MKSAKLLVCNWKAIVTKTSDAKKIVTYISKLSSGVKKNIVVCPPAPFIGLVTLGKLSAGSQTVSNEHAGSTTGKIAAELLNDLKVNYCIVGHSEERARGVLNKTVNEQIQRLLEQKITPIVCLGEVERDMQGEYLKDVSVMINETFANLTIKQIETCIIAYEPVWAIGAKAKRPATLHEAEEAILFIKKNLAHKNKEKVPTVKFLYGGSIDETNASEFYHSPIIDGLLIGRASTSVDAFKSIVKNL